MAYVKFDKEKEKDNVISYINQGLTYKEIGDIYGLAPSTIMRAVRSYGIRRRAENGVDINFSKEELKKLLFVDGKSIKQIGKDYKISPKKIMAKCISFGIYQDHISKTGRKKYYISSETSSVESESLFPVPLEYTYPITMNISLMIKGKLIEYVYVPEIGRWQNKENLYGSTFIKYNIDKFLWELRWIYKLNSKELSGDNLINNIIKYYYNDKLSKTREYIREQLKVNIHYKCNFYCLKEDLIDEYFKTRLDEEIFINYGFSKVPNIIKTKFTKFDLIIYNFNCPDLGINRIWKSSFDTLITDGQDDKKIGYFKNFVRMFYVNRDRFFEQALEIFGDVIDFSQANYKGHETEIKLICKVCGVEYYIKSDNLITPGLSILTHGCPKCREKFFKELLSNCNRYSFDDFLKRSIEVNGDIYIFNKDEFVNIDTPITVYNKITNSRFICKPSTILSGCGNGSVSIGEDRISLWFSENNITYQPHVYIRTIEGRSNNYVVIDFIVEINGIKFWIEYNGRQHYMEIPFFHKTSNDFKKSITERSEYKRLL